MHLQAACKEALTGVLLSQPLFNIFVILTFLLTDILDVAPLSYLSQCSYLIDVLYLHFSIGNLIYISCRDRK